MFAEENSHAEQKTEAFKSSDLQKDVSDDLKEVSKDDIKLENPETENSVKLQAVLSDKKNIAVSEKLIFGIGNE